MTETIALREVAGVQFQTARGTLVAFAYWVGIIATFGNLLALALVSVTPTSMIAVLMTLSVGGLVLGHSHDPA